jgi:hypothetical protein
MKLAPEFVMVSTVANLRDHKAAPALCDGYFSSSIVPGNDSEAMGMDAGGPSRPVLASFEDHKQKLFELYQKCRYNELASNRLMRRYMRVERAVRYTTIIAIFCSLLTGSISYLNNAVLGPVWAIVTIAAAISGVISLIVGSGAKQFHWFGIAQRFRSNANEVEMFSEYVKLGRVTEDGLLDEWKRLLNSHENVLGNAGIDLPDYCEKRKAKLDEQLVKLLRSENKT